jgi:hypothetical protein
VQRQQEYTVDVLVGQVVLDLLPLGRRLGQREPELHRRVEQAGVDASDDSGEERLTEEPLAGLRDHQGDRVGPLGDQSPGRAVRHVPEFFDRLLHRGPRLRADLRRAVDDTGHRAPANPGAGRDRVQGRAAERPRALRCHRLLLGRRAGPDS